MMAEISKILLRTVFPGCLIDFLRNSKYNKTNPEIAENND